MLYLQHREEYDMTDADIVPLFGDDEVEPDQPAATSKLAGRKTVDMDSPEFQAKVDAYLARIERRAEQW